MKNIDKAIALKYDLKENQAPVIIAKGKGILAKMIIDKAVSEGITIVEDANLAEILSNIPENREIPEELYKSIAEIYVFLYKMSNKWEQRNQ